MRYWLVLGLAAAAAIQGTARAETILVEVRRPAAADEAYRLHSMAVERFGGTDGRALANAVERKLAGLHDDTDQPLFDMFEAGRGEGAVSGRADIDVEESRYTEKRRFCPNTRDKNAECDDKVKETVEVTCRRRIVTLSADVRIVRTADGRVIFSRELPDRAEVGWCPGDTAPPETASAVAQMIARAAGALSGDFTAYHSNEALRIREDRKGLPKEQGEAFKAAVRATKISGGDACKGFAAIATTAPDHPSVIYNLGLCAEARGDYQGASDYYRRLGGVGDASAALARVRGTLAGLAQSAARHQRQ